MNKNGFTLLEIIAIIIIMGVIAATVNLNTINDSDTLDNEYGEIKQDLNYLKQLNLNQNFFKGDDIQWIKKSDCFSLENKNKYNLNNNGTILQGQNYNNKKFEKVTTSNITIVDADGNNISRICFDNIGRPYKTDLSTSNLLHKNVTITISDKNNKYSQRIILKPVTGYIQ